MARTLSTIYNEIQAERDKQLALTSFDNNSKMSLLNSIMYIVAVCIWTFENILDVFQVDIAKEINNHIVGTMQYYVNALLQYQDGDKLVVDETGGSFHYENVNESKRIVSVAVGDTYKENGFHDYSLVFKIAAGTNGNFTQIVGDKLEDIRSYMRQIAFAGTNLTVISLKGDVLVLNIKVVHDGNKPLSELREDVANAVNHYLENIAFNGRAYPNKIVEAIIGVEGVIDVVSDNDDHTIGIFSACFNDVDELVTKADGTVLTRHMEGFSPVSGYLRQSSGSGAEAGLPTWDNSITYEVMQ